ncbi:MAG: hypothetical protein LBP52_07610 [Burkholderiaceae bacterium]|jgi:hypothetical protein|nr:hypothetical protein [Burkholderiaceae bacterium]
MFKARLAGIQWTRARGIICHAAMGLPPGNGQGTRAARRNHHPQRRRQLFACRTIVRGL